MPYDVVFDAQVHFRVLMDTLARPGKINVLDGSSLTLPNNINPASVLLGLALLNQDVTFFSLPAAQEVESFFIMQTTSKAVSPEVADFIFLSGNDAPEVLSLAKTGTLPYPETGAFVVIDVKGIHSEPVSGCLMLKLKGPGVKGEKMVYLTGIQSNMLEVLQKKNSEFPLGVDVFFTDPQHHILGLPRSNAFTFF